MIAVVDYGMGNMGSVKNALDFIGAPSFVARTADDIHRGSAVILPGVGAFGDAVENLVKKGLDTAILDEIDKGKPFLGICLGFQMLFARSGESPGTKGLSVLDGEVLKFPGNKGLKIPQIGWNSIKTNSRMKVLKEFDGDYMYFVHSYYVKPEEHASDFYAKSDYGIEFACAVEYENITALQFHPEKSGERGLRLLRKWRGTI